MSADEGFEALGLLAILSPIRGVASRGPALADKSFALLKSDPRHPSPRFKRIGNLWSVRVGDHYRVLGTEVKDGIYWIWIGTHADHKRLVG